MNKEFIPYEQALALKDLGFDEPCMAIYYSKDKSFSWHHHKDHTNDEPILDSGEFNISAPTFSQAFRWFREKYGLKSSISYSMLDDTNWYFQFDKSGIKYGFKTYEEAESACLLKLIEICKAKTNEQAD